ncbi:MAG: hypothetical protein JNL25_07915 [Rhodospirillaceae bacterium]|nr:hypothetical protein [Rhodospirillaceae bacterium]
MKESVVISLAALTGDGKTRALTGKERGLAAREALRLDELDESLASVTVEVPAYVSAISSSFFLGLFAESVRHLRTEQEFLRKYNFVATPVIQNHILNGLKNALIDRGSLTS